MYHQNSTKSFTWSFRARTLAAIAIAVGVAFAADVAMAGCVDPSAAKQNAARNLSSLSQMYRTSQQTSNSIVGLWHVSYTSNGQPFYDALDQWHGDGTELENANVPPAEGNICLGVWKMETNGNVKLNHIGWTFDANGTSTGYFTLAESNRVGKGGNIYRGHFDYKQYDTNGHLLGEAKGTQTAIRITVK